MDLNDVSGQIVNAAIQVHRTLGPGLLESVYEAALAYELGQRGLAVERQKSISVQYGPVLLDAGFRADLVVQGLVIVEIKFVEALADVHKKQLLTYLRLADLRLGLLLNFNCALMKDGIVRLANRA